MMIKPFASRYAAPTENNALYYSDRNPYVKNGFGLPNCTAYACGRFAELHGDFVSELAYGNAENWWGGTTKLQKGQEPQLGAIMCWRSGEAYNQKDGAGHVAVVEDIAADGTLTVSASSYGGRLFYTRTFPKDNYSLGDGKTFQGFIYPKISFVKAMLSPVPKNTAREQIEIKKPNVNFRPLPTTKAVTYGYLKPGLYYTLASCDAEGYKWYLLSQKVSDFGFDAWVAYKEDWATVYPADLPDEKDVQIRTLKERVERLEQTLDKIVSDANAVR